MAQFTVNAARFAPYKNVTVPGWDGRYGVGVSNMSAASGRRRWSNTARGGTRSGRKSPGRTKCGPIRLERGVTHDVEFEQCRIASGTSARAREAKASLRHFRRNITIEAYNEGGQLALAYKVFRRWVSEFKRCRASTRTRTRSQSRASSWRTRDRARLSRSRPGTTSSCPTTSSRSCARSPTRRRTAPTCSTAGASAPSSAGAAASADSSRPERHGEDDGRGDPRRPPRPRPRPHRPHRRCEQARRRDGEEPPGDFRRRRAERGGLFFD